MKILKLLLLITSILSFSAYGMQEERIARKHTALERKKDRLERKFIPIYARQIGLENQINQQSRKLQRLDQIQSPRFQSGTNISKTFHHIKKN